MASFLKIFYFRTGNAHMMQHREATAEYGPQSTNAWCTGKDKTAVQPCLTVRVGRFHYTAKMKSFRP
ncbi:hypothetical protein J1614_007291 [Plenodomus biglobosus]|nr:hypothetical protein J1614_007291 [Plenodomus biglobosus]